MKENTELYKERFNEDFSIRHKVTLGDEKAGFHIHSQLELLLVLSDNMKCVVGNQTYLLKKNTLLLFNDMDLHFISMTKPGINDRYVVYFKPEYAASLSSPKTDLLECFFFRPFSDANVLPLSEEQADGLLELLMQIEVLFPCREKALSHQEEHPEYGHDLRIKVRLAELLLSVNTLYREKHGITALLIQDNYKTIYDIMSYIHKNYWEEISLDFLSREFFISKYYLCTLFKGVTGTTVNRYLTRCRLMKACQLLLSRNSVEAVCSQAGYNNLSHFSRAFKAFTGQSPKQYQMLYLGNHKL